MAFILWRAGITQDRRQACKDGATAVTVPSIHSLNMNLVGATMFGSAWGAIPLSVPIHVPVNGQVFWARADDCREFGAQKITTISRNLGHRESKGLAIQDILQLLSRVMSPSSAGQQRSIVLQLWLILAEIFDSSIPAETFN